MKVYSHLSLLLSAIENCRESGNQEWLQTHSEALRSYIRASAPSGAGIDCGTVFDGEESSQERLVFVVEYHHMDENGSYAGWSTYKVVVTPSLAFGINVAVRGRDRNQTKEYLAEVYNHWLTSDVKVDDGLQRAV